MNTRLLIVFLMVLPHLLQGQANKITHYFDEEKTQIKEVFHVENGKMQGPFENYYQTGSLKSKGNFKDNQGNGEWQYFYENSQLKMQGNLLNNKKNGHWKYYYENGNLSKEGEIRNNIRTGKWNYYYENGTLKSEGEYANNSKTGTWISYYADNTLKSKITHREKGVSYVKEYFATGVLKQEGLFRGNQKDSTWIYYHDNGTLKASGDFANDQKDGEWSFYFPNGNLSSKGNYAGDERQGRWQYFYENGNLSSEGNEAKGQRDGEWKAYYETGVLKGTGTFDNGNGDYREYYENGKLKIKGQYLNSKKEGKWDYFLKDGTLEGECIFKEGQGTYKGYYQDGKLKTEGTIKDNDKVGTWKLYDRDGSLAGLYKPFYEEQEPVIKTLDDSTFSKPPGVKRSVKIPEFRFKKSKIRYFRPKSGEFKGIIVSTNPAATIFGSFPFSVEYYLQERLGYEFQFNIIRDPFFISDINVDQNEIYQRGFNALVKQRFYQKRGRFGMFYFAHELRFSSINHFANVDNLINPIGTNSVQADEDKLEYSILIGDRIMKNYGKPGITLDVYGGLGIGYRNYDESFPEDEFLKQLFDDVNQSEVSFPIRFNILIGYVF